MRNFHVPLPEPLYERLRHEAKLTAQPATTVARAAIQAWLDELEQERLYREIMAYAEANAGTEFDLDEDFEAASLELLGSIT